MSRGAPHLLSLALKREEEERSDNIKKRLGTPSAVALLLHIWANNHSAAPKKMSARAPFSVASRKCFHSGAQLYRPTSITERERDPLVHCATVAPHFTELRDASRTAYRKAGRSADAAASRRLSNLLSRDGITRPAYLDASRAQSRGGRISGSKQLMEPLMHSAGAVAFSMPDHSAAPIGPSSLQRRWNVERSSSTTFRKLDRLAKH